MPPRKKPLTPVNDNTVRDSKRNNGQKMEKRTKKDKKPAKSASNKPSKVDPLCSLASKESVAIFADDEGAWECMLNQTNIQNNNNKYFLLQLVVDGGKHYTWFRWGRVGYNGQNSLTYHMTVDQAKSAFRKKFNDKTKNEWDQRANFVKVNGKYDLVEIQVCPTDSDDEAVDETDTCPPSKKSKPNIKVLDSILHEKVQELIEMICDVKAMERTLKGLDFDTEKSPLGKVTEEQIKAGYQALSRIADILNIDTKKDLKKASGKRQRGRPAASQSSPGTGGLLQACNDFYTRIPHNFGMRVPPMIKTAQEVRNKIELLDALSDIQQGLKVINGSEDRKKKTGDTATEISNPIDAHYDNMDVQLDVVDHGSDVFQLLEAYIKSTHASTHSMYTMDVEDIFECEKASLKFDKERGNRMLLFHGSRMTNFAGILSNGLRIAPPEAPSTGYMFGKGCYFADMSSKSANYCWATKSNPIGLLLLCEVALGETNNLLQADYDAQKLPRGKDSVKGLGRVVNNPENYKMLPDGTVVPMGPPTNVDLQGGALNYNEYIVYNTSQVRMRYLAKIKFNFKC